MVASSEKAIANFLNNYFVNMAGFLNIPSWNPKNSWYKIDLEKF